MAKDTAPTAEQCKAMLDEHVTSMARFINQAEAQRASLTQALELVGSLESQLAASQARYIGLRMDLRQLAARWARQSSDPDEPAIDVAWLQAEGQLSAILDADQ